MATDATIQYKVTSRLPAGQPPHSGRVQFITSNLVKYHNTRWISWLV